jgi:hypothetical protein
MSGEVVRSGSRLPLAAPRPQLAAGPASDGAPTLPSKARLFPVQLRILDWQGAGNGERARRASAYRGRPVSPLGVPTSGASARQALAARPRMEREAWPDSSGSLGGTHPRRCPSLTPGAPLIRCRSQKCLDFQGFSSPRRDALQAAAWQRATSRSPASGFPARLPGHADARIRIRSGPAAHAVGCRDAQGARSRRSAVAGPRLAVADDDARTRRFCAHAVASVRDPCSAGRNTAARPLQR